MLGLRRFLGNQIDIWQGDPKLFALDFFWTSPQTPYDDHLWREQIEAFFQTKVRHGGVFVNTLSSDVSESMMRITKESMSAEAQLNSAAPQTPRRLTFIAADLPIYRALQEALFNVFEDEPDDTTKT